MANYELRLPTEHVCCASRKYITLVTTLQASIFSEKSNKV